jgi:hypothetical protein
MEGIKGMNDQKLIKWARLSRGLVVYVYHPHIWKWEKVTAKKAQAWIEAGLAKTETGKVWF